MEVNEIVVWALCVVPGAVAWILVFRWWWKDYYKKKEQSRRGE